MSGQEGRPALLRGLADLQGAQLPQDRRVLGVEPVGELPEGHAAHVGLVADGFDDLLDGAHVGAAVPGLEVVADDQGRAVALVGAAEAHEQAVAHLVAPELVLVGVTLALGAGLVDHEVVVHGELLVGVPRERHELHRQIPQALPLHGPELVVDAAGVVAEAHLAGRRDEVLATLQAGCAGADELLVVVEGEGDALLMPVLVFQDLTNRFA